MTTHNTLLVSQLQPPVSVHFPVDEDHGVILTLVYDKKQRSILANFDTPTSVWVDVVTSLGATETDGYRLDFTGNMLSALTPDSKNISPCPQIYAMLLAHGFDLPVKRLEELSLLACASDRNYMPKLPPPEVMTRLLALISAEGEAIRMTPESMNRACVEGGRVRLGRRSWKGYSATNDSWLGKELIVCQVDLAGQIVKVQVPSYSLSHDTRFTLPIDSITVPWSTRLAELPNLYVPMHKDVLFHKGDRVGMTTSEDSPRLKGYSGTVIGYATRNEESRGASWEKPHYAVRYDDDPAATDFFKAHELEALPERNAEEVSGDVSGDAPLPGTASSAPSKKR